MKFTKEQMAAIIEAAVDISEPEAYKLLDLLNTLHFFAPWIEQAIEAEDV